VVSFHKAVKKRKEFPTVGGKNYLKENLIFSRFNGLVQIVKQQKSRNGVIVTELLSFWDNFAIYQYVNDRLCLKMRNFCPKHKTQRRFDFDSIFDIKDCSGMLLS